MISYEKTDMNHGTFPVFDGHNDVLTRLWISDYNNPAQAFIQAILRALPDKVFLQAEVQVSAQLHQHGQEHG